MTTLESRSIANLDIVELEGRFDAHEAPAVREWLENKEKTGNNRIIVSLSGVGFIDSTGLSTLVQGMKHARQSGGDLRLCCLQQPVQIIFELTRLDKAFEIFANEESAVEAFAT